MSQGAQLADSRLEQLNSAIAQSELLRRELATAQTELARTVAELNSVRQSAEQSQRALAETESRLSSAIEEQERLMKHVASFQAAEQELRNAIAKLVSAHQSLEVLLSMRYYQLMSLCRHRSLASCAWICCTILTRARRAVRSYRPTGNHFPFSLGHTCCKGCIAFTAQGKPCCPVLLVSLTSRS